MSTYLENVFFKTFLIRILGNIIIVTQFEDEVSTMIGGDIHYYWDPGSFSVLPHYGS